MWNADYPILSPQIIPYLIPSTARMRPHVPVGTRVLLTTSNSPLTICYLRIYYVLFATCFLILTSSFSSHTTCTHSSSPSRARLLA